MSGFDELRDVSNFFTNELRRTTESFSAKTSRDLEDAVTKKIRALKLFSSKLKLLQAKPLSIRFQKKEQQFDNTLEEYGDTVMWKILENVTVKSLTQAHAVKALITTPDANLDPEMIQRKKAIMDSLSEYHQKERVLRDSDAQLKQREAERAELTAQWDKTLGTLRNLLDQQNNKEEGNRGPLLPSLSMIVEKLEIMRWLISQLVCARGKHYDWLEDPHRRLSVLALTRVHNTVDMFTQDQNLE